MEAIIAFENYSQEQFIKIKVFHNYKTLLSFIIDDLELYIPDYDYEPDENYSEDLDSVVKYLEDNFVGDGSFSVTAVTIMINNQVIFEG